MLLKQVSAVFSWKVAGTALVFLTQVILARILPLDDYGTLVYFLTVLGFLAMVAKIGFDNTCMKYVATYTGQLEWGKICGLLIIAFTVVGCFSFLIAWLVNTYGLHLLPFLSEYSHLLPWLFALLPLIAIQNLMGSVLRGLHVQSTAEFLQGFFRSLLLVLLLSLVWWSTPEFHVGSALNQYTVATMVTVLTGLAMVYFKRPANFKFVRPQFMHREWFSTSMALWFTGGMYLVQNQADILMLGAIRGPEEVAYYGVASRISGVLGMGLATVMVIVAPKVAELHGNGVHRDELQIYLKDASRLLLLFTLSVGGVLVLFGKPILWVFGEEFSVAYWPFVLLVFGQAINSAAGPVGQLMNMTGHHWAASRILLFSTILNLAMNAIFIPLWGALGAAMATAVSFIIWNSVMLVYVWRRLGLNPSVLPSHFVKDIPVQ